MNKILDGIAVSLVGISWFSIIENMSSIFTCIASLIACIAGIISIVLKIKDAMKDGKIDKEELKEINEAVDENIDNFKNLKK